MLNLFLILLIATVEHARDLHKLYSPKVYGCYLVTFLIGVVCG